MKAKALSLAIMMLVVIGSGVSATSAKETQKQRDKNLAQIMEEVLRDDPNPVATGRRYLSSDGGWWYNGQYNERGEVFPPNYSDGSRDFMMTAYRMLFKSRYPKADWHEMVNYMWWTAQWEEEGSEFGPYATEFAKKEGVTPNHALAFWSWRQELLRQAGMVMNDPAAVRQLYKVYKILLLTAAGWGVRRDEALNRLDTVLAIVKGTHELCPELVVAWNSGRMDEEYNRNRYGYYKSYDDPGFQKSHERGEASEWFYFLERRRSVGGDELMQAYEDILVDYMWTVAYNDFKFM